MRLGAAAGVGSLAEQPGLAVQSELGAAGADRRHHQDDPAVVVDTDAEGLSAEDEAAVNALPRGSALLIVQRGPNAGSRFLLNTDQVSAGRHQDSDIFLDDISVSRRHATFTRTPDGTVLTDRGSLNGTYVNRDLVDSTLLRHGDEVQIGKFRLIFFASPQDGG